MLSVVRYDRQSNIDRFWKVFGGLDRDVDKYHEEKRDGRKTTRKLRKPKVILLFLRLKKKTKKSDTKFRYFFL